MTIESTSRREGRPSEQQPPERIERDIEVTRSAITEDLRALGQKFTPEHLKSEAYDAARNVAGAAREAVSDKVEQVEGKIRHVSSSSMRAIKRQAERAQRNPLATAGGALILGLGIGLLLPVSQAETRALAQPSRRVREQARQLFDEGRTTARRVREGLEETAMDMKDAVREDLNT